MKNVITTALTVTSFLLLPAVALTSCATTKTPPPELVGARKAYTHAETDAGTTAPTELRAARVALATAEDRFVREPSSPMVRDQAYIAQRYAELASARAAIFKAQKERDAASAELTRRGVAAATELRSARKDLTDAERRAQETEGELKESNKRLTASAADLRLAEGKATGLATDLSTSQQNLAATAEKLESERKAREQAEAKLTATLQNVRDLESVREDARGLVITLSGQVLFASGKSQLLPAAQRALDNVGEALKANEKRQITVQGHTDSQGSDASNNLLSQTRAESVLRYLVSRGVKSERIKAAGFGSSQPVSTNDTAEGRANNRRVEIILAPEVLEPK